MALVYIDEFFVQWRWYISRFCWYCVTQGVLGQWSDTISWDAMPGGNYGLMAWWFSTTHDLAPLILIMRYFSDMDNFGHSQIGIHFFVIRLTDLHDEYYRSSSMCWPSDRDPVIQCTDFGACHSMVSSVKFVFYLCIFMLLNGDLAWIESEIRLSLAIVYRY